MSAPDSRHGPSTPLHARSQSQNTSKPGIRLVPYTPPKLDEERAPSQASSRENAGSRSDGNYDDRRGRFSEHSRRRSERSEMSTESHASNPGPALSSATAPSFSLARSRDERVSGMKPLVSPSGLGQAHPTTAPLRSPSDVATNIAASNASAQPSRASGSSTPSVAPRSSSRPPSRRRTIIALNPDGKTFSLAVRNDQDPDPPVSASLTESLKSPGTHLSYASTRSSTQERRSIELWSDSRAETPMTGDSTAIPDTTLTISEPPSPIPTSPASSATATHSAEDPVTSSPWNYRMVGGVRKVAQTPEPESKQPQYDTDSLPSERPLSPLLEDPTNKEEEVTPTRRVAPKASFASAESDQTIDTISDNTNYKVYGPSSTPAQDSSDSLIFNSGSPANWEALGDATPAPVFRRSPLASGSPVSTSDGNENYVVYGSSSASPSSSLATVSRKPRPSYSQESLRVAPLRPVKKRSNEKFGYYKQRSRETLRSRASSIQSIKSVSSAIANQANQNPTFLTTPVVIHLAPLSARGAQGGDSGSSSKSSTWLAPTAAGPSKPQVSVTPPQTVQMLQSHPHQWSSQLSTVMSESEVDSDPIQTRSVSPLSESSAGHHRRRSSGRVSSIHSRNHSRQVHSISSSIAGQLDEGISTSSGSGSGSESFHQRNAASFSRTGPSQIRIVRDQDEHGDGITELDNKPSRAGLSGFFTSSNGSSRGLHSSASNRSRSNSLNGGSFNSTIPAWARVYYGSGERRWLGRSPSFISLSENGGSRPGSSRFFDRDGSPDQDQFPPNIYSPRKRARDAELAQPDEDAISPAPQDYGVFRTLREKTSSIWSPHLRQDRRATRYSMWDPPSVNWSADSGMMGKRNLQVICFIIGFIFPFAWMIGAILPLPHLWKLEKQSSISKGKQPQYQYKPRIVDEKRYESARWWRNLNRAMSAVGLLIIGAVTALAVIGVKQGWGQRGSR